MSKLDTNHVVNLDLVKDRVNSVIKFGLADVETSDFFVGLYNNGSRVFDKDYIVTLYIVKPNGTFRNIKLEPKEGLKKYYCNLPDTLKNIAGEYVCQVMVFDNLTGEKKISKSKFKYSVSVDLASEMAGIIDEEEQESILTNILNRLLTLENPVEPYATQKDVDECVSTLTEEIDTIKVKDVEQDGRLVNIESKNTEQDGRLNAIETKNTEQDNRLDIIEAKDIEQDNRLVNIETRNTEQDNRLNIIESKDIEQDGRLNTLENKVDGIDEKIVDTIEPTLDNHENRLDTLENKDIVHESRMTNIESKNVEQDNRLTSIEGINTTQNNRLDALETKDIAHESRMANIESKNTEQDNRLNSLESKDLIHESRMTNIESKNTEQDERLNNVESKNVEQNSRLDIAENRLANIGNNITNTMQPIIDAHTCRLDAIEAIDVAQNNRLDVIEAKNQQQDDRLLDIEKVNKRQDIDLKCLFTEAKNNMMDITEEGNSIYLQNSTTGHVFLDEIKGNTLVNCNKEPDKELILNGNINTSGDNAVTITEGVDGGKVDVALEGNTLVNVSKTKYNTAITKAYTVENSGNHIALQGDVDGSCRPVITGNTLWIDNDTEEVLTTFDEAKNLRLQSSFEDNLVTQEMVDSGEEEESNLGKYKVEYKVTGKNKFKLKDTPFSEINETGLQISLDNGGVVLNGSVANGWNSVIIGSIKTSEKNKTYTLKYNQNKASATWHGFIGDTYLNGELVKRMTIYYLGKGGDTGDLEFTITTPNDLNFDEIVLRYLVSWDSNLPCIYDNFILSNIQVEEGDTATAYEPYKEYTKTLYLNSPLLEGDTIEEKDNGIYHVHRHELVSYTEGDEASLITDKVNTLHGLNTPQYELIEQSNLAIPSYTNGHLDFNTAVPVEKVEFKPFSEELTYLYANTQYTVQFISDKAITVDITLGGTSLLAQNIAKGLNKINITTPETLTDNKLIIDGVGANISEVVVTDTNRAFGYFEGMKSVGEYEELEITSANSDNSLSNTQQLTHEPLRGVGEVKDRYVLIDGKWYIERKCRIRAYQEGDKDNYKTDLVNTVYPLEMPAYEEIDYNPLEVYSGTTHITTNSTIPTNVVVKNHGFNCLLKPSTTYTISSNLGLNTVTTPSTLTEDCLRFMDTDTSDVTTMKDVLVLEGDWTTKADLIPANFSGMESAFEQEYDTEKGKYKVNVKVANEDKTKENNITFYINEPLRGIGDAKDRVYVKDDKVVVQRNCSREVFDGSDDENWCSFSGNVTPNSYGIVSFKLSFNKLTSKKWYSGLCNKFNVLVRSELINKEMLGLNGYGKLIVIDILASKLSDISVDGFKQWLQQNPITVVYQLAEPVYEEIEYNDTKLLIESFKNSTLSYNSNVPVTSKLYYSYSVPIVDTVAQTANISDQQDSMIIDMATQVAVMEIMLM